MATAESPLRTRALPLTLIALGGFAGAVLRHAIAVGLPGAFPWGTLAANLLGAFLLGLLLSEGHLRDRLSPQTRLLLGTGFCSSLTTVSTFAAETTALDPTLATANVAGTMALGLAAVVAGKHLGRWVV